MNVNATHRLHRVVDIDETRPDTRGATPSATPSAAPAASARPAAAAPPPAAEADAESARRKLERSCLRAEREGPKGWVQVLPQIQEHLDRFPKHAEAWAYKARARMAQGDQTDALRAAREAVRLDPEIVLGHALSLLVARNCADLGRWEQVARHAEAALSSRPGDAESLELLVKALVDQDQPEKAEATLGVLAQSDADRGAKLAISLAGRSRSSASDRYRYLLIAATHGKASARPLKEIGEVCLVLQRDAEALQWFQKAFLQEGGARDTEVTHTLARLHVRSGHAEDALDVYRVALSATPADLSLHRSYGQLLLKQGRSAEAIDVMKRAARLAPTSEAAPIHIQIAELHQSMGQAREALAAWEAACHADDRSLAAWKGFAAAAQAAGAEPEQRRALSKLAKLDPGSGGTLLSLAKASSGREALELYERAAQMDPASEAALEGAAAARWAKGDRREASAWYRQLLVLQPRNQTALCRRAVAALLEQNSVEAHSLLRSCRDQERPSPEALAWLGYTQLLLGQPEKAVETLQAARRPADAAPEVAFFWVLSLMDRREEKEAEAEFARLLPSQPALQRLVESEKLREALYSRKVEEAGLTGLLPGAGPKLCRYAETLVERHVASKDGGQALSTFGSVALGTVEPVKMPTVGSIGSGVASLGSGAAGASAAPPAKEAAAEAGAADGWREKLYENQAVEVFSKSAGKWQPGIVVQLKAEVVKVKYLIDGQWCEKMLLRASESLRVKPEGAKSAVAGRGAGAFVPEPRASPRSAAAALAPAFGSSAASAPAPSEPQRSWQAPAAAAPEPQRSWQAPAAAAPEPQRSWQAPVAAAPAPAEDQGGRRGWTTPTPAPAPKPKPAPLPVASTLLKLEDLKFGKMLGSGGFGSVYVGEYQGQEVAIKKLHPSDGAVTPMQLEEFEKEVANLRALRHERLVSLVGAAHSEPNLCLVLEYMPNGSLYDLLHGRREALVFAQRLMMSTQITEGVAFLHQLSPPFVHRDLKSLNAVLDFALNVKLCDFGLTQSMEKTHISRRDNEGGSPRYMAPEVFDSRGKITEKVDIWALGCMVVETFTSRLPHEECQSIQQVMTKVLVDKQKPFTDWRGVGEDLKTLAELCFEFQPKSRVDAPQILEGLRSLEKQ